MPALILQLVQEAPVTPADLALPAETGLRRTAEMILSKGLWNTPLEQFAAALNMTPVTFSRHFQTDTGMTFRDWRHRARGSRCQWNCSRRDSRSNRRRCVWFSGPLRLYGRVQAPFRRHTHGTHAPYKARGYLEIILSQLLGLFSFMRLLHSSDWHLGRTLCGERRDAAFKAFLDWLLELIDARAIDTLLIAGDIFDSAMPPISAQNQYYHSEFLAALRTRTACRNVIIVSGNHDSALFLDAPEPLLNALNIRVIGRAAEKPRRLGRS